MDHGGSEAQLNTAQAKAENATLVGLARYTADIWFQQSRRAGAPA